MSDERDISGEGEIKEEQIEESGKPAMMTIKFSSGSPPVQIRKDVYEGIRAWALKEHAVKAVSLRETLAEQAHVSWSGWMKYLFARSHVAPSGDTVISRWAADRWQRQAATPYANLSEAEKDSDRAEADDYLELIGPALRRLEVVDRMVRFWQDGAHPPSSAVEIAEWKESLAAYLKEYPNAPV